MNPTTGSGLLSSLASSLRELLASLGLGEAAQQFLGRLHPMLVHFPIALLVMAAVAEFVRFRPREALSGVAFFCVSFGALAALFAAATGYLNADLERHSRSLADILDSHRVAGTVLAAFALVTWILMAIHRAGRVAALVVPYRLSLIVTALLVAPVGHLGGTLVFGEGYLTEVFAEGEPAPPAAGTPPAKEGSEPAAPGETTAPGAPVAPATKENPGGGDGEDRGGDEESGGGDSGGEDAGAGSNDLAAAAPATPATSLEMYETWIRPLFEAHCTTCHGPKKKKGNLRLHDLALVFARPADEQVIVPGDPAASLLFEMVTLPEWDSDRMPQDEDPLTAEQIEQIRLWIASGADWPQPAPEPAASQEGVRGGGAPGGG